MTEMPGKEIKHIPKLIEPGRLNNEERVTFGFHGNFFVFYF